MIAVIILAVYAGGCAAILAGDYAGRRFGRRTRDEPIQDIVASAMLWPVIALFAVAECIVDAASRIRR